MRWWYQWGPVGPYDSSGFVGNNAEKMKYYLSRGVLPENLRRGPYAVVERAERAKPLFLKHVGLCNVHILILMLNHA